MSDTPPTSAAQPRPLRPNPFIASDYGVAFRCRTCGGYLYSDQPTKRVVWYRGWFSPWRRFTHANPVDCEARP